MIRQKGVLHAIVDTCGHAGGPLHEGTLVGCVVTCPWHGSHFDVTDQGPGTSS